MIIHIDSHPQPCPVWGLLEFKGEVRSSSATIPSFEGLKLGSIRESPGDTSKVHVRIEHNVVDGSKQKLKKPYLVLEKVHQGEAVGYKVVGVVRSKLYFASPLRYVGEEEDSD